MENSEQPSVVVAEPRSLVDSGQFSSDGGKSQRTLKGTVSVDEDTESFDSRLSAQFTSFS